MSGQSSLFSMSMIRLQKFLANAGVASRRASEEIILAGRVAVNGSPASKLGTKIEPARDRVTVDGQELKPNERLVFLADGLGIPFRVALEVRGLPWAVEGDAAGAVTLVER